MSAATRMLSIMARRFGRWGELTSVLLLVFSRCLGSYNPNVSREHLVGKVATGCQLHSPSSKACKNG